MEKDGDYLLLVGFCICTFCMYKSPCQQVLEMKGWEGNVGKSETPLYMVYAVCSFLGVLCVGSWLFPQWQHSAVCSVGSWVCACMQVYLCDSSVSYRLSAWYLSVVTDGHASSDWLSGPMLVDVHLGVICIVIGSFLVCFSSLCFYVFW